MKFNLFAVNKNVVYLIVVILFYMMPMSMFGNCSDGKKRIVFIVNPISHEIKGLDVRKIVEQNLDLGRFEYRIVYTQHAQHATQLAQEALLDFADIIAAVGGDGTVNEVGKALIHTQAALAIIPVGSGNGLARHLGIPVGLVPALQALNRADSLAIDTAKVNDRVFLGVAGIGFDAHIAKQFAAFGKRGFFSYVQVVWREFSRYEPQSYLITIDGKQIARKAFILAFANSSQYGNDFMIAPQARVDDGYLDLVIIKEIPGYLIPQFIYQFRQGTLDHSRYVEVHRFKELTIQCPSIQAHLDGEPALFQNQINVLIQPHSLKVMH